MIRQPDDPGPDPDIRSDEPFSWPLFWSLAVLAAAALTAFTYAMGWW